LSLMMNEMDSSLGGSLGGGPSIGGLGMSREHSDSVDLDAILRTSNQGLTEGVAGVDLSPVTDKTSVASGWTPASNERTSSGYGIVTANNTEIHTNPVDGEVKRTELPNSLTEIFDISNRNRFRRNKSSKGVEDLGVSSESKDWEDSIRGSTLSLSSWKTNTDSTIEDNHAQQNLCATLLSDDKLRSSADQETLSKLKFDYRIYFAFARNGGQENGSNHINTENKVVSPKAVKGNNHVESIMEEGDTERLKVFVDNSVLDFGMELGWIANEGEKLQVIEEFTSELSGHVDIPVPMGLEKK
jgi:hypothetical protein